MSGSGQPPANHPRRLVFCDSSDEDTRGKAAMPGQERRKLAARPGPGYITTRKNEAPQAPDEGRNARSEHDERRPGGMSQSDDAILGPDETPSISADLGGRSEFGEIADAVNAMRAARPRIHALVSPVAQPFVANIAASLAIDVSMSVEMPDVKPMIEGSDAVLINLGMLDAARRAAAKAAISTATPFVLDPVKVDRSPERLAFAHSLVAAGPLIIKGNAGEMEALAPLDGDAVLVGTGPLDTVVGPGRRLTVANDTPILARVIATGCATGFLMTAIAAVEPDPFVAALAGAALMAVAGELAAEEARLPGSFAVALIDRISELNGEDVARHVKLIDV